MAKDVEITCILKTDRFNPHERIQAIGGKNPDGTNWRLTQVQAIEWIESGRCNFFVVAGRVRVDVVVAVSRFGNKYIKTTADGDQPNNLLSLNECRVV